MVGISVGVRRGAWRSRPVWVGSAAVVGVAVASRIPGFVHQLFDPDEAAIATMGMVVQDGGVLYRDVIDRKPPLAALVYAASFVVTGGRDLRPVHLVAALGLGLAAVVLALGARRVAGPAAGWWAAGLFLAGATALPPVDAQAANFAHLAVLPAAGAIVAARRGTGRSAALAGVLLGLAILTRQTWVLGLAPAAYAAWWWGERRWSGPVVVAGTTVLTVASVAVVAPFGAFWHWTFAANGSVVLGRADDVLGRGALAVGLLLLVNVATVWLVGYRGRRRDDVDLWLWLGTGLVAFTLGFRFFPHYWFQVLPPLCLLAGLGAASCPRRARRLLVVVAVVPAVAFWAAAFTPRFFRHADTRTLATYVRNHSDPGDRVTIWGSAPEVYWRSGRMPGGAMVISDFVVGRTAGRRDGPARREDATPGAERAFLASLGAHPPELILDTSTAGLRDYEHYPLEHVESVAAFVRDHYRAVAVVQGTTVYRRRGTRSLELPTSRRRPPPPSATQVLSSGA